MVNLLQLFLCFTEYLSNLGVLIQLENLFLGLLLFLPLFLLRDQHCLNILFPFQELFLFIFFFLFLKLFL